MRSRIRFGAALAVAALALLPGLAAGQAPDTAITRAVAFIIGTQQADGGFGGFGDGQTFDAVFAIRAAGIDPTEVETGGNSPADFLQARAGSQSTAGAAAKAALAARALGLDPADVGGVDLIAAVEGALDDATGQYQPDDFGHGLAIIGLACTGNSVPDTAIEALRESQLDDGGWGFDGASDPDTTAVGLQALLAAGVDVTDDAAAAAIAYFRAKQGNDGGWGFSPDESNTASTAFAMQALIAAGEPIDNAAYEKNGVTPREYLLSQQLEDGSFSGFDPAYAAIQVVPALAGRTLCNAPDTPITASPPPATTPSPTATATATATATTTPSATATATSTASLPTQAPAPPQTGSGTTAELGPSPWPVAVALAVVGLSVLAGTLAARRR